MTFTLIYAVTRLRAAWAVLTAERCVVITYDPKSPVNALGHMYLCAPSQEIPERLINAALVADEWDKIDSREGQTDALRQANEILDTSYC